ncbi:hypothetical protein [Ahrensia sp. R2A130]|uniref:hypothetical protein n=1 Tax=Ahrensia sp. R2A130 TaxID=744979 RepID=UPI0018DD9330|nr:hypothetical protein [Ahrensia sp. R2A130]
MTFAFDTATQPQRYGPPVMKFERLDQVAESLGKMDRERAGLAQLRLPAGERTIATNNVGIDRTVTGSIAVSDALDNDDTTIGAGPKGESLLLFSAKGRALLSVSGRMIIAAPGTRLPDGDIIQHVGINTVTTRGGRVFEKTASGS